jgi:DNA-binding response OmpR family regulator
MDATVLIILVEDEPSIRSLLVDALEDSGYAVAAAASGEEATALLDARAGECRALITDVRLRQRGLTGWDVGRHARALNHELPIVYITADGGGDWAAMGVPKSVLITKPFAPAQIIAAVSQLLNEASTSLN